MVAKAEIVRELGAEQLLLPALIEDALVANEQVKYRLALLQQARAQADAPARRLSDLRQERLAARIEDATLDAVVSGAVRVDGGPYRVPRGSDILAALVEAVRRMIRPLADDVGAPFGERLAALTPEAPVQDLIKGRDIERLASVDRGAGDSLHLLVMDVHKALNRLQAGIATETIAGASTYALSEADKPLVAAFMSGVGRTAALKFDHPGLGTTATTSSGRLVIQNDIGTTDAHVIVVVVDGLRATITYTDVHLERLAFLQRQLAAFGVAWTRAEERRGEHVTSSYALSIGSYTAADREALASYLDRLGSRLVFLIDWNRARKQLRRFVGKADAIELLDWAAEHDVGHRGFLEIGGERAVFEALQFAAAGHVQLGDRLDDVLGRERAMAFLRIVLEAASRGLTAGRSPASIRDEIKVELRAQFESDPQRLLALAARHAALLQEIASAVVESLSVVVRADGEEAMRRIAERAARWEAGADGVLNEARGQARQMRASPEVVAFLERADDAADGLEEAAFLLTQVARHRSAVAVRAGEEIARLLDEDARAWVSGLECARHLDGRGTREDLDDFLAAMDRVFQIEHLADAELREASARAIAEAEGFRDLHLATKLAEVMEGATDSLAHAAQLLRRFVLEEVMRP